MPSFYGEVPARTTTKHHTGRKSRLQARLGAERHGQARGSQSTTSPQLILAWEKLRREEAFKCFETVTWQARSSSPRLRQPEEALPETRLLFFVFQLSDPPFDLVWGAVQVVRRCAPSSQTRTRPSSHTPQGHHHHSATNRQTNATLYEPGLCQPFTTRSLYTHTLQSRCKSILLLRGLLCLVAM